MLVIKNYIFSYFNSISYEIWIGAIIGAIISALFMLFFSFLKGIIFKIKEQLPVRKVVGDFANDEQICSIFLKNLYSHNYEYLSNEPNFFPPYTKNTQREWQNIPFVIANSDFQAATDFTNILGQIGKRKNIIFRSIENEWDLWSENILSIGGNYKTEKIFELSNNKYVEITENNSFKFNDHSELFFSKDNNDFGLIYKATNPATQKKCFVIMGIGVEGTKAASYYFRTNLSQIGKMFGKNDFALLVKIKIGQGRENSKLAWYLPNISLSSKLCHPLIWKRIFSIIK